jgi:hypothetical protein
LSDDTDATDALDSLDISVQEEQLARRLQVGSTVAESLTALAIDFLRSGDQTVAGEDDIIIESARDWTYEVGLAQFASAFPSERVFILGNPAGIYERWGLARAVVADRGVIIDFGDADSQAEIRVWSDWASADEGFYRAACVTAYADAWDKIGLPPMAGDCWDGDRDILGMAIASLLEGSSRARELFTDRWASLDRSVKATTEREMDTPQGVQRLVDRYLDATACCP